MLLSMMVRNHRGGAAVALLGAILACGSATQAQTQYRVPSLRPAHARGIAQSGPTILKDAREKRRAPAPKGMTSTLNDPYGLTVGQGGVLYVTNIFAGITMYSPSHKYLGSITSGVSYPAGVAVAFNGNIYVANNATNNVTIYSPAGVQVGTITDSTLINPLGIYIDQDDTIWVLDGAGTVHSYLSDGTFLPTVHTGGTAIGPWGPYVTVWGILNSGGAYDEVYQNRAEADRFGASFQNIFPSGSPYAGGEAQDGIGQQYVSDILNDQVQIWDRSGFFQVGVFPTPSAPYGVAVDSANKRFYVAMTTRQEVYVYSTVPPYKQLAIIH